jgi:hypothetical protein
MRRHVPLITALAAFCVAGRADAGEGRTSSLSWVELSGAEACGGATSIAKAVEQRLGRAALVSPAQADLSIEGHAERVGSRLRAVLVLRDGTGVQLGSREIESEAVDCSELRENVALAVALMIDPDAVLRPLPPLAQPPPPPPSALPPAPPPPTIVVQRVEAPVAPSSPAVPWQVEPAANIAIGYGFLPSVSVGALVSATVLPPRTWPVEVYGGVWAAQRVAAHGSASAELTSTFVGLGICPLSARRTDILFLVCAAGQVGVVGSAPTGFLTAQGGSMPTVQLVADAHLSLSLTRSVVARAGGSLAAALLRSKFVFDDAAGAQTLFDASVLAATADLGLAVTLP